MRQAPLPNPKTLNSWKEIASYLGRGVRTVQRWEAELALPVHRLGTSERASVFAFRAELDNWLRRQASADGQGPELPTDASKPDRLGNSLRALDRTARLHSKTLELIEKQQVHTRLITEQLQRMSHLLPTTSRIGFTRSKAHAQGEAATSPRLASVGPNGKPLRFHSPENS